MIYFYFLGRQTGKTTKAIEIFNRDVDNMLMVHNTQTKQHLKDKILREALINPKHNYLLDRKIKSINESLIGYRCNNLIIDEPLDYTFNITGFNKQFNDILQSLTFIVQKDVIIFQSIEDPKLFEDIQIAKRIFDLYKINQPTSEKEITKTIEDIYHKIIMVDLLSEQEKEIINLKDFKLKVLNLINKLPFYMNIEIIMNKLPD